MVWHDWDILGCYLINMAANSEDSTASSLTIVTGEATVDQFLTTVAPAVSLQTNGCEKRSRTQ